MKIYMTEVTLAFVVLLYMPFVGWLLWKLWAKLPSRLAIRISTTTAAFVLAMSVPLWDVAITSYHMAQLCPKVGIFVKRSVNVDGFYTNFGSPDMLDRGFKYIESRPSGDRLVVYRKEGDKVKTDYFDAKEYQVQSRYEFIYDSESGAYQGRRNIGVQKSVVRDRKSNEELGYSTRFYAYPGWLDRNSIALLTQVFWTCDADSAQNVRLLERVLFPTATSLGR